MFAGSTVGTEGFSRKVAIKKVLPGFSDNPQFSQMFVAEAQITSRLVHPNIVSVMDFDRDAENRLFLVMEMVEGKDLDNLMATGTLPFPVVVYVVTEILRGLGYAHDLPVGTDVRGVIHRDVSPHNVLLSWEGAVKVSDFGIAKAKAASEATASVFIKGKPAYMSPEQANGQSLDGRSDLFAVGIIMWEMLVGRRLFTAEDTRATLAAVLFGQIQRPRMLRGDIPKDLERVAMKLLERELPARYATADHAIAGLLECHDAPKNGRDVLRTVLAERFPHQMPERQSVYNSRISQPPGTTTPVPAAPPAVTYPQGVTPRPAVSSLSAAMAAPTSTMLPNDGTRPPNRTVRIALVIGVTAITALLTFAIVSGLRKKSGAAPPIAALDAAPAVVASAVLPDAGTPPPIPDAAPPPPDAASVPVDAPPPPLTTRPDTHVKVAKKTGLLVVQTFPVVTVFVDGKRVGESRWSQPLPVGKHKVRLLNTTDAPYDRTHDIEIKENQTVQLGRQ